MTSRNLAIVWAPNLLRPKSQDCLKDCGMQAIIIESMIVHCSEIFEENCVINEISIDQAVAKAENFYPKKKVFRSFSCSREVLWTRDNGKTGTSSRVPTALKREHSLAGEVQLHERAHNDFLNKGNISYHKLCQRHKEEVDLMRIDHDNLQEIKDQVDQTTTRKNERTSRSKLRTQFNRFRNQSKTRLRSFVSDDLRSVKEGIRKSREKLKRRSGSYTLNTSAEELEVQERILEDVIQRDKSSRARGGSKCDCSQHVIQKTGIKLNENDQSNPNFPNDSKKKSMSKYSGKESTGNCQNAYLEQFS